MAPLPVPDTSLHLAGLLDSQYEPLLAQWSARAAEGGRGAPELAPHVPALLRQLIGDLSSPEAPAAAAAWAPLPERFDLEAVVLGYGLLQRLVLELLEGASVPVSMRDVRRLGDWFTRAVAAAAAAHARAATAAHDSPAAQPRRTLDEPLRDAEEETLRSAGQAPPSEPRAAAVDAVAEDRWLALLQQAPLAVSVVRGPEFVYELANPLALAMIGGRDVIGKSAREAFPELGPDAPALQVLERVYRSGQPFAADEYAIELDLGGHGTLEEMYFKFTCQPILDASGKVQDLLLVALDVSAQVRARRHAEALVAELKLVDQRKDEFLAMLAHELRNPMAAISTALILLDQAERDPAQALRYREIARRQTQNLVRLVDDLLDMARISRGKVELRQDDVDLGVIVQHALGATRPAVEAHQHELHVTIAPGTFRLVADGTRLEQVIVNLIANAAKFTDPGGTISVTLEHEPGEAGPWARLSVRDTGRGISTGMLGKVFDPFTQVSPGIDRRAGGLGLGLTLVKHLVEMHGGSVSASSAGSGQGSEFCVRLPLAAEAAAGLREAGGAGLAQPGAPRQRVLVVEDSDDVRELLEACIRDLGHDVFAVENGLEGAAALEREQPTIALIDIGLPGIDGYELARRARASLHGRGVRLIALSGYGGADAEQMAHTAGFDRYVTKPIGLEALRELLAFEPSGG